MLQGDNSPASPAQVDALNQEINKLLIEQSEKNWRDKKEKLKLNKEDRIQNMKHQKQETISRTGLLTYPEIDFKPVKIYDKKYLQGLSKYNKLFYNEQ